MIFHYSPNLCFEALVFIYEHNMFSTCNSNFSKWTQKAHTTSTISQRAQTPNKQKKNKQTNNSFMLAIGFPCLAVVDVYYACCLPPSSSMSQSTDNCVSVTRNKQTHTHTTGDKQKQNVEKKQKNSTNPNSTIAYNRKHKHTKPTQTKQDTKHETTWGNNARRQKRT